MHCQVFTQRDLPAIAGRVCSAYFKVTNSCIRQQLLGLTADDAAAVVVVVVYVAVVVVLYAAVVVVVVVWCCICSGSGGVVLYMQW